MNSDGTTTVEGRLLPPILLLAILGHVIPMCLLRTWLQGYYGAISVTQFNPWYLCNIGCLQCTETKPHQDCFWMDDWANTGYDQFGIIQHLEYWCLAGLVLCCVLSAVLAWGNFAASTKLRCCLDLRRPNLLVLFATATLSTASISLFGQHVRLSTDTISNYESVIGELGPGFYVRALASGVLWLGAVTGTLHEYKMSHSGAAHNSDSDRYAIVTQSRTIEELLDEDDEEDGQFL